MNDEKIVKSTANKSLRTFTLRVFSRGKLIAKYRTYPFSPEEYNRECYNTSIDWLLFLKFGQYYVVNKN